RDWSSDVCSSDLVLVLLDHALQSPGLPLDPAQPLEVLVLAVHVAGARIVVVATGVAGLGRGGGVVGHAPSVRLELKVDYTPVGYQARGSSGASGRAGSAGSAGRSARGPALTQRSPPTPLHRIEVGWIRRYRRGLQQRGAHHHLDQQ